VDPERIGRRRQETDTLQEWHGAGDAGFRDAVMKDRQSNGDGGRIRPELNLQEEPGKVGRSEGDNGCPRKAPVEPGTETSRSNYVLEVREQPAGLTGRPSGWRS
jgi:hypothetical protein